MGVWVVFLSSVCQYSQYLLQCFGLTEGFLKKLLEQAYNESQ